jgi:hypothetical protein
MKSRPHRNEADPHAGVRIRDPIHVGARVGKELAEIVRRHSLLGDQQHRHVGDHADVVEVVQRVVGQLAVERG